MAVLNGVRGIKVTVCVDGHALEEYDDDGLEIVPGDVGEYQASRTVARYIESHSGKEFEINFEVDKAYDFDSPNLSFWTSIDGTKVSCPMISKAKIPWHKRMRGVVTTLENGRAFLKPFLFTNIITCDEDTKLVSVKEDAERLSSVGEIVVKVYRKGEPLGSSSSRVKKLNLDTVHEKALKKLSTSHSTTLGAPQFAKAHHHYHLDHLDGKDYPVAIYRFKYRSKESLQSLAILETSPEPDTFLAIPLSPISDEVPEYLGPNNLDETRKVKPQDLLGKSVVKDTPLQADKKGIKRERDEAGSRSKAIKREAQEASSGFTASKRARMGERVEIDLTADDSD